MKLNSNSKSIILAAVIVAALVVLALIATAPAKAGEPPMTENEKIVSTLVLSEVACQRGDAAACATRNQVCKIVTPERRRELFDFIRNDYPYKAKNGAAYITVKFGNALRNCA